MLDDKVVLITGGTGSFGKRFARYIFENHNPRKVIVFSRDEYKQYQMSKILCVKDYPIRYFIGDVRDRKRLDRAFNGVDYVVHAAALKQIPALEYNPMEAVKTNVIGANNIVDAAIDAGVGKVLNISTDKAVNPINLYGATKMTGEKIFTPANAYSGNKVKFSSIRYGNVLGSRGSIIQAFLKLKKKGVNEFPLTSMHMTRFFINFNQMIEFAYEMLVEAVGGEVFIPKIPSMKIRDVAKTINPDCRFNIIGIRPGEKIHEVLISKEEAINVRLFKSGFVILPQFQVNKEIDKKYIRLPRVEEGFSYTSDNNSEWLREKDLKNELKRLEYE